MKSALFRKIFKALNEDLNMILSDDEFEEPEIDLGVHLSNIQRNVALQCLKNDVAQAIANSDATKLKECIQKWDGDTYLYSVNDDNILDDMDFIVETFGNEANLNWIDTSNVTDMKDLFLESAFNGDISKWDVSNVVTMESMFQWSVFNGDISGWDVSNVQHMKYMFADSKFNGDISNWNVSNVRRMNGMFADSKFNGDISKWDVSNVVKMQYMFKDSKFNRDISKWDVSNVTHMDSMFQHSKFNQDISGWDVSNCISPLYVFYKCPIKNEYKPKRFRK